MLNTLLKRALIRQKGDSLKWICGEKNTLTSTGASENQKRNLVSNAFHKRVSFSYKINSM